MFFLLPGVDPGGSLWGKAGIRGTCCAKCQADPAGSASPGADVTSGHGGSCRSHLESCSAPGSPELCVGFCSALDRWRCWVASCRDILSSATGEPEIEPGLGHSPVPGNVTLGGCLPGETRAQPFPTDAGEAKWAGAAPLLEQSAQRWDCSSCPPGMVRTRRCSVGPHAAVGGCLPGACGLVAGSRCIPWVSLSPRCPRCPR